MTQKDPDATLGRFPKMKLLALSEGQPFLYLQECGAPDGKQVADDIIHVLRCTFSAEPLGAKDGFDWIDIDFQIGTVRVTLTSDCWLGLGLIGECGDDESLLLKIATLLDPQSAVRLTTDASRRKIGE